MSNCLGRRIKTVNPQPNTSFRPSYFKDMQKLKTAWFINLININTLVTAPLVIPERSFVSF